MSNNYLCSRLNQSICNRFLYKTYGLQENHNKELQMTTKIAALCSALLLGASIAAWAQIGGNCSSIVARGQDTAASCGTPIPTTVWYDQEGIPTQILVCSPPTNSQPNFGSCGPPYQGDYYCRVGTNGQYEIVTATLNGLSPAQLAARTAGIQCYCNLSSPVTHNDGTYGYVAGGCPGG